MSFVLPSGLVIERDIMLAPLTSWVVGGPAEFLAQPRNLSELKEALAWGRVAGLPVTILGGGTNVLVSDRGIQGLTLALRKFSGLQVQVESGEGAKLRLECLSGTSKSDLLKTFLKNKLEPALFLAGLPGDVGGGVVMNAGVGEAICPREFVEITDWVEVLRWKKKALPRTEEGGALRTEDGPVVSEAALLEEAANLEVIRIPAAQLKWSYRHCEGWRPGVITSVGISWPVEPKDDILARVKAANHTRLTKQPLDMPSCGSVFVNPPGQKSGQLIEQAGLKGFAIGGAKVSEKHANFIVNFNRSTADDIYRVISEVKRIVREKSGVELKTEVVMLGEWTE